MSDDSEYLAFRLLGTEPDLHRWELALKPPQDPWVEKRDNSRVLRSRRFDVTRKIDAYGEAADLVELLNGALKVTADTKPVSIGGIWTVMKDGSTKRRDFTNEPIGLPGAGAYAEAGTFSREPRSPAYAWLSLAEKHQKICETLHYMGTNTNWYDLYKIYECCRTIAGGAKKLAQKTWAPSKAILKTFTWNANYYYRHARDAQDQEPPPNKQMSLEDAAKLIRKMVRNVLIEEVAKGS